jgi:hypothetical protein
VAGETGVSMQERKEKISEFVKKQKDENKKHREEQKSEDKAEREKIHLEAKSNSTNAPGGNGN